MVAPQVIRATACAPEEVRALLEAMPAEKVGHADFAGILEAGQCFKVIDQAGATVGAYVLRAKGSEVWISAAAGRAGVDLTAGMFALIEQQSGQFDSIGFQTKRRGLVKKAQRHGYEIAVYIMLNKTK